MQRANEQLHLITKCHTGHRGRAVKRTPRSRNLQTL